MATDDDTTRAFPADRELLAVKESMKLLEEMLCRPPAGLTAEEIESVRVRRVHELVRLARELLAEVEGRPKPRWRGPLARINEVDDRGARNPTDCGGKELDCKSGNCSVHGNLFGGRS